MLKIQPTPKAERRPAAVCPLPSATLAEVKERLAERGLSAEELDPEYLAVDLTPADAEALEDIAEVTFRPAQSLLG